MPDQYFLADGSFIEWIDKETLKYTENNFSASIWVDYEPGFLSGGRIIRSILPVHRHSSSEQIIETIEPIKKEEIITKVLNYYHSLNTKCRVAN